MERQPNTIYVACISHGKDSNAMLHVIKDILHYPLDRIITTDVWFDDNLRAELPPMVEWKDKADKIILDKWGIPVEHLFATRGGQRDSYTRCFSRQLTRGKYVGAIKGFPQTTAGWCKKLKYEEIDIPRYILSTDKSTDCERERESTRASQTSGRCTATVISNENHSIYGFATIRNRYCTGEIKNFNKFSNKPQERGAKTNIVQYIGIAYDEPKRIERHKDKKNLIMPLVDAKWTEKMCYEWCEQNDLLAPTYTTAMRDGCWFCHNQGVGQLRNLYHNYPDLWEKLMELDNDSPVSFHADGHTVHDFDKRFKWEDEGYKPCQKQFRWDDLEEPQMNVFQFLEK